jgi:hypothetical protein
MASDTRPNNFCQAPALPDLLPTSRPPTVRSARSTMFDRQAFEEPATHLSRAADRHVSYVRTVT